MIQLLLSDSSLFTLLEFTSHICSLVFSQKLKETFVYRPLDFSYVTCSSPVFYPTNSSCPGLLEDSSLSLQLSGSTGLWFSFLCGGLEMSRQQLGQLQGLLCLFLLSQSTVLCCLLPMSENIVSSFFVCLFVFSFKLCVCCAERRGGQSFLQQLIPHEQKQKSHFKLISFKRLGLLECQD